MSSRFEVPEDLSTEDERAVLAALERYLAERDPRPNAWTMAGRIEATRDGALQARRMLRRAWTSPSPFARYGTEPISGRGDSA